MKQPDHHKPNQISDSSKMVQLDAHPQPVVGGDELREQLHNFAVAYHVESADGRNADLDYIIHLLQAHTDAAVKAAQEALLRELADVGEIHHSVFDYRLEAMEEARLTKGGK